MYKNMTKEDIINYIKFLENKLYKELERAENEHGVFSEHAKYRRSKWGVVADILDDLGIMVL